MTLIMLLGAIRLMTHGNAEKQKQKASLIKILTKFLEFKNINELIKKAESLKGLSLEAIDALLAG